MYIYCTTYVHRHTHNVYAKLSCIINTVPFLSTAPVQSTPHELPLSDTPPDSEPPITHNEGDTPSNEEDRVGESPRIEVQGLGEEEGDPEYSWTPCDDALLLSNIQTYFDDDYDEDPVEPQTDLTATNNDLSKVLPDGPPKPKPTALVVPPARQQLSQPLTTHPPHSAHPPPAGYTPAHLPHSALSQQSPAHPPPAGYTPAHPPPYSPHPPAPYQYSVDPSCHDSYLRSSSYPVMQVGVADLPQLPPPSTPPAISSRIPTIDRTCKPTDNKLHVLTSLGEDTCVHVLLHVLNEYTCVYTFRSYCKFPVSLPTFLGFPQKFRFLKCLCTCVILCKCTS